MSLFGSAGLAGANLMLFGVLGLSFVSYTAGFLNVMLLRGYLTVRLFHYNDY